jgi:4-alpha-glucanotransferase
VLSSRVLTFEREADGAFRPSAHISDRALVSANTHDLAPLAGWWAGRDLELRRDVGQIATDETLRAALGARAAERRSLLSRLAAERIVPPGAEPPSPAHLAAAVHAFLCRSGAPLVGIALDDLAGEVDPINIPGTRLDQYPSWSRRARLPIEALRADAAVALALSGASARAAPR